MPWLYDAPDVLSTGGIAVAVVALVVFTALNAFGVVLFTRINNALTWVKLFLPLGVIVLMLSHDFNPGNFTRLEGGFAPMGFEGVFAALATGGVVLSFLGFRHAIDMAGETANPQRTVPLATPLSALAFVIATLIIYWGGRETAIHLAEAIGVGVLLFAVHLWRSGPAAMDLRQGWWLAPYLLGLFALCWLGRYQGGLGILPFGWDLLIVSAFA
ncbi:MAG: amino acid permease, partial [Alphaproteobacteria bacterium]